MPSEYGHVLCYIDIKRSEFSDAEIATVACSNNYYNRFTALVEFVRDYPGELVPER